MYNGWTNYQTWCVNLWLTNEPETAEYIEKLANATGDEQSKANTLDCYCASPYGDIGMHADLLNEALQQVNWREIIENHRED